MIDRLFGSKIFSRRLGWNAHAAPATIPAAEEPVSARTKPAPNAAHSA